MLKKSSFALYLINEYKTSSLCPDCEEKLEKFKIADNLRPYRRKDMSKVKCKDHSPSKLGNRDLVVMCNFRKILMGLRETEERPSCFGQTQPLPRPSHMRKQGENPSSNKRTKIVRLSYRLSNLMQVSIFGSCFFFCCMSQIF